MGRPLLISTEAYLSAPYFPSLSHDNMGNEHGEVTESTSYPASRKSINLISDGGGRGVRERGRVHVLGRIRART
jgi:hypothetical protein